MLALPLKSSSGGGKSGSTADVAELLQAHIEAEYSVEDGKAQAGTLERLQTLREAARAVTVRRSRRRRRRATRCSSTTAC